MELELNGLEVSCIIGERPEERVRKQTLVLDLVLEVDDAVAESDRLADAADYAALAGKIASALEWARCRMIERAARVACDVCLLDAHVRSARIRVTKRGAVPHLASASATCERSR